MTAGVVALFVIFAVLAAAYALYAPVNKNYRVGVSSNPTPGLEDDGHKPTFFEKYIRPTIANVLPQTPKALTEYARKNSGIAATLAKTGNPWRVSPEEYVVIRVLAVVLGIMVLLFMYVIGFIPAEFGLLTVPVGAVLGYIAPKAMLDSAWAKRRRDLNSVLPEALDLLRICMDSGYNFTNGLQQTVDILADSITKEELGRVVSELRAGKTVHDALYAFAVRCPTDSVEAFVRAISQAQATGVDIATTLAYQAEETRAQYERQIEVRSQKLQTTLFLPLIGFFIPSLLIIIFGPAVVMLMGAL